MGAEKQFYQDLTFDFLGKVQGQRDPETVFTLLDEVSLELGVTGISIFDYTATIDDPKAGLLHNSWRGEWVDRYAMNGYLEIDPVYHLSKSKSEPFWWSKALSRHDLTRSEMIFMGEAAEFGMNNGYLVPIHNNSRRTISVTMSGQHLDEDPLAGIALQMISLYCCNTITGLTSQTTSPAPSQPTISKLTRREFECLKWASAGKTNWEIGEILSISENTVRNHMSNLTRKLDVGNRVEAISLLTSSHGIHKI